MCSERFIAAENPPNNSLAGEGDWLPALGDQCWNVGRRHSKLIINLLYLMTDSGIKVLGPGESGKLRERWEFVEEF